MITPPPPYTRDEHRAARALADSAVLAETADTRQVVHVRGRVRLGRAVSTKWRVPVGDT